MLPAVRNFFRLEPLLSRIKENPTVVACPLVDDIRDEDLSYAPSDTAMIGLFTWSLYYKWGPTGLSEAERKRTGDVDFDPHRYKYRNNINNKLKKN